MAVLYVTAFLALLGLATPCSPPMNPEPETMARSVHYSDVVLVGTPHSTTPWGPPHEDAYDALFNVSCIYKLKENVTVPHTVNIKGAGYVAAMCHSTNLTVGRGNVIIFLRESDGRLEPNDAEKDASPDNLAELAKACGVSLTYPDGVKEDSAKIECPKPGPAESCEKYVPLPVPTLEEPGADRPDTAEVKEGENGGARLLPLLSSLVLTAGAILISL